METLRLVVTVLGGLLGLALVGWTVEARQRAEERQAFEDERRGYEELCATIEALSAQLKNAGRAMRRLRALEALAELMGW